MALTTAENTITMETCREPALPRKGDPGDKQQRWNKQVAEAGSAPPCQYLTMSHFHCSPSGQKLLTPSRYRRALCSVSAHTTLFRAVTWDSGQGQSTFMALAQGRSTLRPAREIGCPQRKTVRASHPIFTVYFFSLFGILLYSFVSAFIKGLFNI